MELYARCFQNSTALHAGRAIFEARGAGTAALESDVYRKADGRAAGMQ